MIILYISDNWYSSILYCVSQTSGRSIKYTNQFSYTNHQDFNMWVPKESQIN